VENSSAEPIGVRFLRGDLSHLSPQSIGFARRLVASFTSRVVPPTAFGVDLVYLKNRLFYLSRSQGAFLGEEFPSSDSRPPVYPFDQCDRWDIQALPQRCASQHSQQRGLWVIPGALDAKACSAVVATVATLTKHDEVQGVDGVAVVPPAKRPISLAAPAAATTWAWHEYGPARWMVPLQPSAGVCSAFARGPLSTLSSHSCTDARGWPELSALASVGGDALRGLEAIPAKAMPGAFAERPALFLQVQRLQRGASIGAHVDQHDVGGRAIVTAVVAGGGGDVRVGGVSFAVRAGDVYALVGEARDAVDHEVYASAERDDRLSVTVRFGGRGEDVFAYPAVQRSTSSSGPVA